MEQSLLSIILPTYDEEENIIPLVTTLNKLYSPLEIIVVDDSSSDDTIKLVKKQIKNVKNLKLVVNNPPLGLTASLQKGIDLAKGKFISWMDADFSHPPQLIKTMLGQMKVADIVVGSWLIAGGEDKRKEWSVRLYSWLVNAICQFCFGSEIHAYTSGFILTKKSIFSDFRLSGNYGEYCIDFLVKQHRLGRNIVESPLTCISRKYGLTKTAPNFVTFVRHGAGYLKMIISLSKNRKS